MICSSSQTLIVTHGFPCIIMSSRANRGNSGRQKTSFTLSSCMFKIAPRWASFCDVVLLVSVEYQKDSSKLPVTCLEREDSYLKSGFDQMIMDDDWRPYCFQYMLEDFSLLKQSIIESGRFDIILLIRIILPREVCGILLSRGVSLPLQVCNNNHSIV